VDRHPRSLAPFQVLPHPQKGGAVSFAFPRKRALAILSTDKDCAYCGSAIAAWKGLQARYPGADWYIYDRKHSYAATALSEQRVDASRILTEASTPSQFSILAASTPSFLLISRSGNVLGYWKGEATLDNLFL